MDNDRELSPIGNEILNIYPDKLVVDDRPGYQGYIVMPENLFPLVKCLRDQHGYDYLSSITAVDYFPDDRMEVVYHFYCTLGGKGLEIKTQISRDHSKLESLVPLYPGAEFQEREIWDLFGINFNNHPDLRRILLWEGFSGHPLRKDWQEAYFEEETKPFATRWPEGKSFRIEDKTPLGDNVQYPPGFNPDTFDLQNDASLYQIMESLQGKFGRDISTEQMIVNMGPQHPSTHGVFRMVVLLDGEMLLCVKPVLGYMHRNHEKIGERNTWLQNMPFTDRLDYVASMSNNIGYAIAVEKLMGIQPPERAEYLRVIMAELTRIQSHLVAIGFLLNDLGAFFTPALYGLEERELILDIFEAVSGSRMMCNYSRFGGVVRDLPDGVIEKIKNLVHDRLPRKIDVLDRYLTDNEIVKQRCEGIGVLTSEEAISLSTTGPVLRASGVPYDVRRAEPYSIYDRFEFDVVVGSHGDVYDRYLVRMEEIRQSLRILEQAIKTLPEGPVMAGKSQYQVKVPPGDSYGRIEGPKGEVGFYVVSNGKSNPWRYHVRSASFINLTSLNIMMKGAKIADAVAIIGSIDIVMGEVDR